MARIVCGTGKTTVSHMLCHGLGLLGQRSVCVLTAVEGDPLDPAGRRYLIANARSREALEKVVDKIQELTGWMGVIDGGADRADMDRKLYGIANIVLLPYRASHEDIRSVRRDLDAFPRAYALPAQWPTNPWQRDVGAMPMG
jgi:chromosome partitioning protein